MNIYFKGAKRRKGNQTTLPNIMAFNVIRDFLRSDDYEDMRKMYFIKKLNHNEINQAMRDVKWLFREYKGLEVISIEHSNGNITKFKL